MISNSAQYAREPNLNLRQAFAIWSSELQPKFLSTHPEPKERIKDIEKKLPRVLPLYTQKG